MFQLNLKTMEKLINYFFEMLFQRSDAVSYRQKLLALSTGLGMILIVILIMLLSEPTNH